jgi:hypothetical protein
MPTFYTIQNPAKNEIFFNNALCSGSFVFGIRSINIMSHIVPSGEHLLFATDAKVNIKGTVLPD